MAKTIEPELELNESSLETVEIDLFDRPAYTDPAFCALVGSTYYQLREAAEEIRFGRDCGDMLPVIDDAIDSLRHMQRVLMAHGLWNAGKEED